MKRYRWFARKSTFDSELGKGNIGINDICFVLDRLRLYTRSTSFEFSNRPIYQGETSISDSAGTWTVTIDGITEIYNGLTVKVQLKTAQGEIYSTLNVNGLGAYPVWFRYGIPLTSANTPIQVNTEVTLTYRTVASNSSISIEESSYSGGWVMDGINPTYGEEFTNTNGTLGLNFGSVTSLNINKPVTGAAVANSLPTNYIESALVSGTTLTLETNNNESIVYSHPTTAIETTITEETGKVLSSITVNGLGHVTSVAAKILAEADIPNLSWSKITTGKPTTLAGYGISDASISSDTVTLGQNSLNVVTKDTAQTISGVKTFSSSINGNITGNAATATIAQRLASQGTSDYFLMADGSLSNGYDLVDYIVDQFSADSAGTLVSVQCSSTVYDDIFT